MRKVIVLEPISLDGVIQAPGRTEEDTISGFAFGGLMRLIPIIPSGVIAVNYERAGAITTGSKLSELK